MTKREKWYAAGLHFECTECGNCCSGPDEGVIWVTKEEIRMIADFLGQDEMNVRQEYMRKLGNRTTIIEAAVTRDCIFLETQNNKKICTIYPVRPNQCRTWPFWTDTLQNPDAWNETTQDCPGINRGKHYSLEEIEKLRKQKRWWDKDHDK